MSRTSEHSHDESPRPVKRRRLKSGPDAQSATDNLATAKRAANKTSRHRGHDVSNDDNAFSAARRDQYKSHGIRSETDSEDAFETAPSFKGAAATTIHRKKKEGATRPFDSSKPRHRSRVQLTLVDDDLQDVWVSEAPTPASSPARLRGAIWLKNPPAVKPEPVIGKRVQSKQGSIEPPRSAPKLPIAHSDATKKLETRPHTIQRVELETPSVSDNQSSNSIAGNKALASAVPPSYNALDELADLPSDAFESSPPPSIDLPDSPRQQAPGANRPGPLQMRQTTLNGAIVNQTSVSVIAPRKQTWRASDKVEAPTHHALDLEAAKTWIYPLNLGPIREYQFNIVSAGLFNNLLVALPTGLGKTFIAATIMLNWFRWTKIAQIVFLAPTKPLVAQQIEACSNVVGIPRSSTVMLTGTVPKAVRAEEWLEKRVFFMTPQTLINDLKFGTCDPKKLVLLVIDEAHRATGNYAYVEVVKFVKRFNTSFKVLALTATPGSTVDAVQKVIDGLDIARVEIRTEASMDIRRYVHNKDIQIEEFEYSEEQAMIMDLFSKTLKPLLSKLNAHNACPIKDPMKLTPYILMKTISQWSKSEAGRGATGQIRGLVHSVSSVLNALGQAIPLLRFHGIGPFLQSVNNFKDNTGGKELNGKTAKDIRSDPNFVKMVNYAQTWQRNPKFFGHPKLQYLVELVMNHFLDAEESGNGDQTRIMVFANFRDSAEEIVRVLGREEKIKPRVFVGQSSSKNSEGMNQKTQLEAIQNFKDGRFNVLVATSVGEEGLDIGEVDLIICYDASSSPIRMLQRMGRTGRKRQGKIVLLLMKKKEVSDFASAKDNYEKMQGMIASGTQFNYHDDKSPRILPKEVRPVVNKCVVEVPLENSQTNELPEPRKAKKRMAKRPAKKFHMPDGVRTGFVRASRVPGDTSNADDNDDDDNEDRLQRSKTKRQKRAVTPEAVELVALDQVFLNKVQEKELERKYQYINTTCEIRTIMAPQPERQPEGFVSLSKTCYVGHGRLTRDVAAAMQRMRSIDDERVQEYRDKLVMADVEVDADVAEEDNRRTVHEAVSFVPAAALASSPLASPVIAQPRARAVQAARQQAPQPRQRRTLDRFSSAIEAVSSSPPITPAEFRLRSQAIDLGSGDTSGEDESEEELDSELASFVVGSDQPIEMVSSSLPELRLSAKRARRRAHLDQLFEDDEEDDTNVDVVADCQENSDNLVNFDVSSDPVQKDAEPARKRRGRVVLDSEDSQ